MAYIIDDDENRTQALKERIDELEIQTFSSEIVARNESTRNTGVQSGDGAVGNPFPLRQPIQNIGVIPNIAINILFLNRVDSHVFKFTMDGDTDIQFINNNDLKTMMQFVVDITQDGTGGHNVNFINTIQPSPTIGTDPNQRTIINLQTTDQGSTYQVMSLIII